MAGCTVEQSGRHLATIFAERYNRIPHPGVAAHSSPDSLRRCTRLFQLVPVRDGRANADVRAQEGMQYHYTLSSVYCSLTEPTFRSSEPSSIT